MNKELKILYKNFNKNKNFKVNFHKIIYKKVKTFNHK